MEVKFSARLGSGLEKRLPNVSRECLEVLKGMLAYDSDERLSAY
jgi:hypothetical protein